MSHFLIDQGLWNHPNHFTTFAKNRVGNSPHQADRSTSIHDSNPAIHQQPCQLFGSLGVLRAVAPTRTRKNAVPHEYSFPYQPNDIRQVPQV